MTVYNTPTRYFEYVNRDLGLYAQDTWTMKRLTVSPGIRFDMFNAKSQGGCRDAGRFAPAFCRDDVPDQPNWNNISPRMAAVYDLFGNARTALKAQRQQVHAAVGRRLGQALRPVHDRHRHAQLDAT